MVAKIRVGSSLYGALAYNQSKVDSQQGKLILSNKMIENSRGDLDLQSCLGSFNLHLPQDIKTEKPIMHISLNPHPDDKLTDSQFADIAEEYMERMGYGDQPYVVYKHEDIERHHIHIVALNVDSSGKKIDDSNNFYRSKAITRDLEQKYGLRSADKKSENIAFTFKQVDTSKGDIKTQIDNIIKPLSAIYRFQSFNEYRTLLSLYNIKVEESKGSRNGHNYTGLIYYATDEKGTKISNPFKSSLYGASVGYNSIHAKIDQHKVTIKDKRLGKQTVPKIQQAVNNYTDKHQFINELKDKNIDVIFRENDSGRIYGVTFIDHNNHTVFNGSKLGKEFSANAFQELFNNPTPTQHNEHIEPDNNEQVEQQSYIEDDVMGGLLDLFSMDSHGDDPEEDAFRRRMKKKKKGRKL